MNPKKRRAKKKHPASTGLMGDLDSRRWIIIRLRNNGATDAQFPLPVTHNTHRIVFNRDEMVIAPAYYLDVIKDASLLRYEDVNEHPTVAKGQLQSTDQAVWVGLEYQVETHEIPEKYQSMQGIWEFAEMVMSEEDLPPELEPFRYARLGQQSYTKHNEDFDRMMQEKSKKRQPANANNNKK